MIKKIMLGLSVALMLTISARVETADMSFGMPMQFNDNDFSQMMNMLKDLEQNPEDLKAFQQVLNNMSPADIEKAAEAGRQMMGQMSPKQLEEFADTLKVDPSLLKTAGTPGPDFEKPLPEPTPKFAKEKVENQEKAVGTQAQPAKMREIKGLTSSLINHLESLLQKSNASDFIGYRISGVKRDIALLLYFLKIINKDVHFERLSQANYEKIYQAIKDLTETLSREEPKVMLSQDETEFMSPYDTLGVSFTASQKGIDAAYKKLIKKHDKHAVKRRLLKAGASQEDIEEQLRLTNLARERVEEAYEAIGDPKMREQINRGLSRNDTQKVFGDKQTTQALKEIVQAINTALFSASINDNLERFIQQYAPEEMKKKKFLEEAEKTHLEELKWKAFKQPVITYTGPIEPQVTLPRQPQAPSEGYGYGYPGGAYPSGMYPGGYPQPSDRARPEEKPAKEAGSKDKKDKEQDKDKGKGGTEKGKELTKEEKDRKRKSEEVDKRSPEKILKEMNKQLEKLKEVQPEAKRLISKIPINAPTEETQEIKKSDEKKETDSSKKKEVEGKETSSEKVKEKTIDVKEPEFGGEWSDSPLYEEIEKQKGHTPRRPSEEKEKKEPIKKKVDSSKGIEKALGDAYEKMELKKLTENAGKLAEKYALEARVPSLNEQAEWQTFKKKFKATQKVRRQMVEQIQNMKQPPTIVERIGDDLQNLESSIGSLDDVFKRQPSAPLSDSSKQQLSGLSKEQLEQLKELGFPQQKASKDGKEAGSEA